MEIQSKSAGVIPSSQNSGQGKGRGFLFSRLGHALGPSLALTPTPRMVLESGGFRFPRQCPRGGSRSGTRRGRGAWGEPTDLGAGLLSGRIRCAGRSRVPPTSEHERREPSCRPLTHRPTDRPTSGPSGSGPVWSPRDGGGTHGRLVPERRLSPALLPLGPPLKSPFLSRGRAAGRDPSAKGSLSSGTCLFNPAPSNLLSPRLPSRGPAPWNVFRVRLPGGSGPIGPAPLLSPPTPVTTLSCTLPASGRRTGRSQRWCCQSAGFLQPVSIVPRPSEMERREQKSNLYRELQTEKCHRKTD